MTQKIKSILLVDDDPDDRLLFEEALADVDHSITYLSAIDGIDALEKLRAGMIPDLLFMDVNMPRMNGIDCLKEIAKSDTLRQIPVVMYSTSSYYQKECRECGAIHYIEKPTAYAQLYDILKKIVSDGLPVAQTVFLNNL